MISREYRLYHYTCSCKLQLILEGRAFWPQFCAEDFQWMNNGMPLYLMVPMVSFCDMPAELSEDHQDAYGCFAIGLSKKWGRSKGVTPVLYLDDYLREKGPLIKCFPPFQSSNNPRPLVKTDYGCFWGLLPYFKPVTGCFPDGRTGTEHKDFDEEMEWRFVPPKFQDHIYNIDLFDEDQKVKAKQKNEETRSSMLAFVEEDVEVIIVPCDKERKCLISKFPEYKKKVKIWKEIGVIK